MHVNLLPAKFRLRLVIRRRLRQWTSVVLVGIGCLGVAAWHRYSALNRVEERLAIIEEKCAPLRKLQSQLIALQALKPQLLPHQEVRVALAREHLHRSLLGVVSRATQQIERVQVQQLSFDDRRPIIASEPAATPGHPAPAVPRPAAHVVLRGIAADESAISDLMTSLRSIAGISAVELKSIHETDGGGLRLRQFQIEFQIREAS